MRIGELAIAAKSDVDTIRYDEKIGMLPKPDRTDGNYRYYHEAHADRLRFVRHCRALDMTLDEVGLLLQFRDAPESDCADVNQLLDEDIGHVTERIEALTLLEKERCRLRRQCRKAQKAPYCGCPLRNVKKGEWELLITSKHRHSVCRGDGFLVVPELLYRHSVRFYKQMCLRMPANARGLS